MFHPDLRVISLCGWRRNEDERRALAGCAMRLFDQFFADPTALTGGIDGQIGEVTAVGEICYRAGDANQSSFVTRRNDQIGKPQHIFQTREIVRRAPFRERRRDKDRAEFRRGQIGFGIE